MDLSDMGSFRTRVAGGAMIAAPLVIVVAELLHARFETEAAAQLAAVAESTDRWYAAHLLILVSLGLAVPVFFALAHAIRRSRPAFAHAGTIVFVAGLVALTAVVGMELVLWQMAQQGDQAAMVALAERVNESAGLAPVFLGVLLFPIAWLLAGIGLYLARAVPAWTAALIGVSQPVGFVGELAGGPKWLAVAAQLAFALGLVPLGIAVLRGAASEKALTARPSPAA